MVTGKELGRLSRIAANAPTSLGSSVYNELRQRIIEGHLKPGERLREIELSELLGVSRTPVREAIKRLENEGLAAYVSSRGAIVAELTPEQASELYAVREILEGAAAGFAARHANRAEVHLLESFVDLQRDLGPEPEAQARANRQFHQTIYHMAHNRYLLGILSKAQDYMVLLHRTTYYAEGRWRSALDEHAEILEAIKAGDSARAEQAARDHIREAQRIRMMLQFGI